jgi:hypothetical protein
MFAGTHALSTQVLIRVSATQAGAFFLLPSSDSTSAKIADPPHVRPTDAG